MNVTTQDDQLAVFAKAAAHLAPGGCFVVEVLVPQLRRVPLSEPARVFTLSPDHVGSETFDDTAAQPALPLPAACRWAMRRARKGAVFDLLRRGWPPGAALWGFNSVLWGFNSAARSSGPVYGAAAAVRGTTSRSGRLSLCFPGDEASRCEVLGPAATARQSGGSVRLLWFVHLVVVTV